MRHAWILGLGLLAAGAAWEVSGETTARAEERDEQADRERAERARERAASARDRAASARDRARRRVEVLHLGGGGRLGVSLDDVGKDDVERLKLGAEKGAVVESVEDDSAARKAGVQEGDVIVAFRGEEIWSAAQLARLVRETPAGRSVPMEVSRGGATQRLTVVLAEPRHR